MEQNSEITQATNAWLSYMQIFRTAEKHMLDEYKRKLKKHEPITWDDFERIDSSIKAMMKKAVDEKEMSLPDRDFISSSSGEDIQFESKNMKKKVTKLNEQQLRSMIAESVKRVLGELYC